MRIGRSRLACAALLVAAGLAGCDGQAPPTGRALVVEPTMLVSPALPGSGQARLATTASGVPLLSWLEPSGAGYALRYAELAGAAWAQPRTVASGTDWFVNWADLPSVVPIDATTWIAHWLVLEPGQRYAYDIIYSISSDAGRSWSSPRRLNDDETVTEHGFVTFFGWGDDIGVVWLDGRRAAALSIDELLAAETLIGTSLRFARLSRDGSLREQGEIDELTCDCCQTDVALADGVPVLVYRDRTQQERRDIVVRRLATAGATAPVELGPDGWIIDGCPVNGPAIDARGATVVVAWFTAAEERPRVRLARSQSGGLTFAAPVDVAAAGAYGQVDVVLLDDGRAVVSWWQRATEDRGMQLVARPIGAAGELGEQRAIAASTESLPVDVPQLGLVGATLIFAWSELDGSVETVAVPVW